MNLSLLYRFEPTPRLTLRERALFVKRLSFLLRSHIEVHDALSILTEETSQKRIRVLFATLRDEVEKGTSLGDVLAKHSSSFGTFVVVVVRMGERIGALKENLEHCAVELTKHDALVRKVRSALIYPTLITSLTILTTGLLITFIMPKIVPIFISLRIDIPLPTRILIAVSDFLKTYGLMIGICLVIMLISLTLIRPYAPWLTRAYEYTLLRLPLIGTLMRSYHGARIARTVSLALVSHMHITDALHIAYESETNGEYRRALAHIRERVEHGESCGSACSHFPFLFPSLFTSMTLVGERTGTLGEALSYVGELYTDDVDTITKNLGSSIEPVLLILMGIMIGLIAVSVITPIYEVSKHLYG